MIEIESLEELDRAIEQARAGSRSMRHWQVQDLDLTAREPALEDLDPRGALFLGCTLSDATADELRAGGALLFPAVPDVPFNPWRASLYTPTELYDGLDHGYPATRDARIYAWSRRSARRHELGHLLAAALHDSSIDDALAEVVHSRRIVGVMGGHALTRADDTYADTARLGHALASRGCTVATGGGPGAMEAANLGAPARRPRRRRPRRRAARAGVRARLRGHHGMGPHRSRRGRRAQRLGSVARHPDVALRPRAAQPVRLVGGEVLP
jgi:hypothetical protein